MAIRAHRGTELHTKGWLQEAALRCLQNNLDPEVAENPDDLVVYGGTGRAARNWESFHAIVASLESLENDETLLVQSGKPVGILRTHPLAPRVLIANSLLVPEWATWEHFWELEAAGLMMYGQMTAGSWIYIGTQGILQGTFQTFVALADLRFGGSLAGTLTLTAGLGGMGGAQPLAVTMNEGTALVVEIDPVRLQRRLEIGYLDEAAPTSMTLSIGPIGHGAKGGQSRSGSSATPPMCSPRYLRRGFHVDVVTDQTSAHDPLNGYVPNGFTLEAAAELRRADPASYISESRRAMAEHCSSMVEMRKAGAEVFDYGNNLRGEAVKGGFGDAFDYPGFRPGLHPSIVLRRSGTVSMGGAVGRPGRHRRDRSGGRVICSRTTTRCIAGWRWPGPGSRSRVSRPASAGSDTGKGIRPGSPSTNSWRVERSRHRS